MRNFWPGRPFRWQDLSHRLFFDPCCMLCARRGQPCLDLCESCEKLLVRRFQASSKGLCSGPCTGCGQEMDLPVKWEKNHAMFFCVVCRTSLRSMFSTVVAPYRYSFPLDAIIQRMKYRSDRTLSRCLGTLLSQAVVQQQPHFERPDILLPMPLHRNRLRQRGYNQAQDIARWCGRELSIVVDPTAASRIVDTPSMAAFGKAARQHHIIGAFQAADTVVDKRIAIVDDVLTTGATARELARELYDTGAESVELWVLARTSRPRDTD